MVLVDEIAVKIENLRKVFRGPDAGAQVEVFEGFDLDLRNSKTTVVIGPSGCGKSTLLNILAGIEAVDAGSIRWAPTARRVGYMFQKDRLFPWRTALQNVLLGTELSRNGREEAFRDGSQLLLDLGLQDFANAFPHQLSEGMRQRVALARTLVIVPDVLLLDEPFSSLDFDSRLMVERMLLQINATKRLTTVLVTHDLESALVLGDEIVILEGRPCRIIDRMRVQIPKSNDPFAIRRDPVFYGVLQRLVNASSRWSR